MHDISQMLRMAAGGVSGQVTRAQGGAESASALSAATFTTAALGISTAAADRFVVAAIQVSRNTLTSVATTAVTIGGVAATKLVSINGNPVASYQKHEVSLWGAMVPSGTTAVVAVTTDLTIYSYSVSLEAVYGAITTPAYTVTLAEAASAPAGSIMGVRNGLVFCAIGIGGKYSGSVTTETSAVFVYQAYALPTLTGSISPLSGGSSNYPYVAASFAPI